MKFKTIIIIVVSIFIAQQLLSQNWNLINANERYHFQHINDSIPLHTILVDSVKTIDGDSVFYLNRFFLPCDTCSNEGYYLDNQPGFLQREIINSGKLRTMVNPDIFFIQVTATIGNEWWFDNEQTQKAKVTALENGTVFGGSDSIMTISINGVDKIKIAKDIGLIEFFDYKLSGLEFAGLGKCLPGFNEFYDFEVGDVFQYRGYRANPDGDWCAQNDHYLKREVISVEKNCDSVLVEYKDQRIDFYYPYCGSISNRKSQVKYINYTNHYANTYINQKIPICNYYCDDTIVGNCERWDDEPISFTFTSIDNRGLRKYMGYSERYRIGNGPFIEIAPGLFEKSYYLNFDRVPSEWNKYYEIGLGKTFSEFVQFETAMETKLIGYVKNCDTTGIIISDDYIFDGLQENDVKINIFPNPSTGKIAFDLGNQIEAEVEIYSLEGRLITKFKTKNEQTHHLDYLHSGVYIINLNYGKRIEQFKWIKL